MKFQAETRNGLQFFQELLFHLIDNELDSYDLPAVDLPVELSCFPVRTARFCKIVKVVELFSEESDDGKGRGFIFYDQATDLNYEFTVTKHANGITVRKSGVVDVPGAQDD